MTVGSEDPDEVLASYRQELYDRDVLLPSGADGIYGLSGSVVAVIAGVESLVRNAGHDQHAEVVRFPPVIAMSLLERSGYVRSFPDLIGFIRSFDGDDRAHRDLLRELDSGAEWTDKLGDTGVALCAAACHPLYPTLARQIPAGGRRFDVYGYVFRHEPSLDPARMQSFRQYEFVFVGEQELAVDHRDVWRERAATLLSGLGLDVEVAVANDPFYGRVGRSLAESQRDQELKWEVLARTSPVERPTAIASANYHRDHFGTEFALRVPTGTAHSACVGFGVERIALALVWRHGADPGKWPGKVREQLGW